ncbi:MAG TPA: CDP-glycerol glycerophosphotransferase family protein [Mycobacteriales bacterium]|nr:CDP-glycerol glycerophosphotransferase family protein [Mycobacteriales bacterium]
MDRANATSIAIRALNAMTPKAPRDAVLYGFPPLNDAVTALLAELPKRGVRCHVFVDTREAADRVRARALSLGASSVVHRRSREAIRQFVTARYVFLTHMLYDVRPNRRQKVVNLWHGEFTKRIDNRPVARSVHGAIAIATSRLGASLRATEFDIAPDKVLLVGNPRTDRLLGVTRAEARKQLGLPRTGPILLWLPTYRLQDRRRATPPSPSLEELQTLDRWLGQHNATLVVKHHPLTPAESAPGGLRRIRHLHDSDEAVSIGTLMAASDGLITDFSSAWVDFLLLDRPIWIHWPDHVNWSERDQIPLAPLSNWSPGPVTVDVEQLIAELTRYFGDDIDEWAQRRSWLRPVLHTYVDEHNTERLLDALHIGEL